MTMNYQTEPHGPPIWSRECVSKFAELGVKEATLLPGSAKPYFGAEVQRSREKYAEREQFCLSIVRRKFQSPELQKLQRKRF